MENKNGKETEKKQVRIGRPGSKKHGKGGEGRVLR
jgi:hypothetical protein